MVIAQSAHTKGTSGTCYERAMRPPARPIRQTCVLPCVQAHALSPDAPTPALGLLRAAHRPHAGVWYPPPSLGARAAPGSIPGGVPEQG